MTTETVAAPEQTQDDGLAAMPREMLVELVRGQEQEILGLTQENYNLKARIRSIGAESNMYRTALQQMASNQVQAPEESAPSGE